jgi:hypothetical protein
MKGMDQLVFNVRALDNKGVCESSTLITTDLDEAISKCRSLLSDPARKWVIVADTENECVKFE